MHRIVVTGIWIGGILAALIACGLPAQSPTDAGSGPPGELVVRVVDRHDRPTAGVPVEVWDLRDSNPPSGIRFSGQDGRARFRLPRKYRAGNADRGDRVIQLGVFGPEAIRTVVPPGKTTVHMTLPKTRRLVVPVRLEDGSPVPDGVGLVVHAWNRPNTNVQSFVVRDGRIVIPWVCPGTGVQLVPGEGYMFKHGREPVVSLDNSPENPTTTPLVLIPAQPLLHGRVVWSDGRPVEDATRLAFQRVLASGDVDVRDRHRVGLSLEPLHFARLPRGGFGLALEPDSRYRSLRIRAVRQGLVAAEASVDLQGIEACGFHDLGTVRLEPPEIVAAGHVRDAGGHPLAHALVRIHDASEHASLWWVQDRVRPRVIWTLMGWMGLLRHARHRVLECHTDTHGRFELNGQAPLPAVDLEVETTGYPTRVFPGCRAGARDLNLVLGPTKKSQPSETHSDR